MKKLSILVVLNLGLLCLIPSCRKAIESGTRIGVTGKTWDMVKNKYLANSKIYLYGALRENRKLRYYYGPLDSTVSDNTGRFAISFVADGSYLDYGLALGEFNYGGYRLSEYNYGSDLNCIRDYIEPVYKFKYKKSIANAIVKGRELNYTKVHLKVLVNPFDSFYLNLYTYGLRRPVLIVGQTIDTTITMRHLPNERNVFWYYTLSSRDTAGLAALNSNPNTHHYSTLRLIRDTLIADMRDTMVLTKIIPNSLSIPRQ